jgi:serine/threonine-protein kinase TTK/MPS1
LSLLGRGGSCKVFKVQSIQDQSILALKRIKLSRIDRKTIAMFENEIDLMERLRGRDNIIQLVDSEINVSKKLIYMVMEAGEMDLAHTLENKKIQQMKMNREKNKEDAIHSSLKGGGLDVQFLRETWQQVSV